jgi:hypothetical protein
MRQTCSLTRLFACLLAAGPLWGCATTPPPATPLPYHFTLADISDARPSVENGGTDPLYDAYPYDAQAIALGFTGNLPYSIYGAREARLHLKVTHYQATADGTGSYAMSIAMEGYADDDSTNTRQMARFGATCSEVQREGFALDAIATESWQEKSARPLTPPGRDKRMWQAVLKGCTQELARQFSAALMAKGNN